MPRVFRYLSLGLLAFLGACSHITPYQDDRGKMNVFADKPLLTETGIASWYRDHRTASGQRFDGSALTAAHKKLPFNSHVRVIDLKTNRSIIVRINDRGPYIRGRIIDLTVGGARALGMYDRGIAKVKIEVLREIPLLEKPNLHLTQAEIKQDQLAAASRRKKAVSPTAPKVSSSTKPSVSSAKPKPSPTPQAKKKKSSGASSSSR